MLDENELLFDVLYERTKDFGRTQFIREIMRLEQENKTLKERIAYLERSCERKEETIRNERDENIELSNKIDKAIKFIENAGFVDYERETSHYLYEGEIFELLEILKDSDVDE